jgi:hypothetical protein
MQRVEEVLKGIWEKAYTDGEFTLEYSEGEESECRKVYFSLNDYRKKINANTLGNYEMFLKIQAVILQKPSDLKIVLTKKSLKVTKTTEAVLNVVNRYPDILGKPKTFENPVHAILDGMRKN